MYSFENIVGNKYIIRFLQSAISNNKVTHAYILDGQAGIGKKLIANTFAKTLQCEKGTDTPCQVCHSCKAYENNNHPDVFFVKTAKSIGVDDIREQVNTKVEIRPYKHKYIIFIIEDADTMTIQAQNALLKTIEEPPSYAIFILLSTNSNSFLQTILSRCVLLKIKPLLFEEVNKYLIEYENLTKEKADLFSTFSEGNIGRAKILSNDVYFIEMRDEIISILISLSKKGLVDMFLIAKEITKYKDVIQDVLDIFYLWYRDVLVLKETSDIKFLIQKENIPGIEKETLEYSTESLYNKLSAIWDAKISLKQNSNFQLTLEVMFLNIKEY